MEIRTPRGVGLVRGQLSSGAEMPNVHLLAEYPCVAMVFKVFIKSGKKYALTKL
jgi:hypothetical protein